MNYEKEYEKLWKRFGPKKEFENIPIKVRSADGTISTISFKALAENEMDTIGDNLAWVLKNPYRFIDPKGKTKDEIEKEKDTIVKEAYKSFEAEEREWFALRDKLYENPDLLLALDDWTEHYITYEEYKLIPKDTDEREKYYNSREYNVA